ncbi:unknown [Bacteroides sp. CAG:545]|nr:unknown [Bacteroides sp. CAG:545]
MKKTSKIIITIVAIVVFFFIFAVIVGVRGEAGHSTPGMLGLIAFAGLIGGLKAVWKKSDDDNTTGTDIEKK